MDHDTFNVLIYHVVRGVRSIILTLILC